jgi:hypothetical protein
MNNIFTIITRKSTAKIPEIHGPRTELCMASTNFAYDSEA